MYIMIASRRHLGFIEIIKKDLGRAGHLQYDMICRTQN